MKKADWLRPLILAAFLLLIGTLAYWLEFSHKPKKEEQDEEAKKVLKLKDTAAQTITVTAGDKIFSFKCLDLSAKLCKPNDQSKWELTQPLKAKADDSNVNLLFSTLNNLTSQETIDLSADSPEKKVSLLKEYGLSPESLKNPKTRKIEVLTEKGLNQSIFLGETHSIGDSIFAKSSLDESRVYLLPSYFKGQFEHDLTFWRDKKILTLSAHEIQKFDLTGSKLKVSAEKKDGQWYLTVFDRGRSEEISGDTENIDSLLRELNTFSAKKFITENKSDPAANLVLRGLKPLVTFTAFKLESAVKPSPSALPTPAATPITLTFFEKKKAGKSEALYVSASNLDPLFELDTSNKDKIDKNLKDLRLSKLITNFDRFNAKRLEFAGQPIGSSPLTLTQKEGKWFYQPENAEAESEKIQTLLEKLSGSKIQEFIEASSIPAGEKDGIQVTFLDEKGSIKRQLLFWKDHKNSQKNSNDKIYARDLLSKRKEAFLLDSAIRDALPWSRDFFNKQSSQPSPAPSPKK